MSTVIETREIALAPEPELAELTVFDGIVQGTDEWYEVRRGLVTASVVGKLITPTMKVAANETSRGLYLTLAAERITGHTEEPASSKDMERGTMDEPYARDAYSNAIAPVTEVGFMTRDLNLNGVRAKLGFSPDGLVGDDGLIEIKSRAQKTQLRTILSDQIPAENMGQMQAGLLVSGRAWCDYTSYCGGMPLWTKRVEPDEVWIDAILAAVEESERSIAALMLGYESKAKDLPPTERIDHYAGMTF